MTRISTLNTEKLSPRQREVYDAIVSSPRGVVRGPLAVWLNRPELADLAQSLGRYCRYDTLLPPNLSELAILVTARVWNAEFEWQAHKKVALAAGVDPVIIDAIRRNETPQFNDPDEELVYKFALSAQRDRQVNLPLFDKAISRFGKDTVVDLTGFLGYYALISMTINVFDVDPIDPNNLEMS